MSGPINLSEVRAFVIAHDFHPSRALGQNFLIDRNILDILIRHAAVGPGDHVLEIGPGLGALTTALLRCGTQVTAVEKDHRLCGHLRAFFPDEARLTLIEGDALEQDLPGLAAGMTAVVANLPYSCGSRILVELCGAVTAPPRLVVTVQQEVAARLTAAAGSRLCGLLTVLCGYRYDCEMVHAISPNCFWPRPAVGSAVVVLTRTRAPLAAGAEAHFLACVHHAFKHRRKQLATILAHAPDALALPPDTCRAWLRQQGLAETARPEDLSVDHWRALAGASAPACVSA